MDIYLARQAIYDLNHKSIAYELLYRSSNKNRFTFDVCEDEATLKVILNSMSLGFYDLLGEKIAFINFTKGLLLRGIPSVLPKKKVVIEILENVEPSKALLESLQKMKSEGYSFALDDVTYESEFWVFRDLIDIYKIDFKATTSKERLELVKSIRTFNSKAILLAEKVENESEYLEAKLLGCIYFQGFFFSKPLMMEGRDIPIRNITCFGMLSELYNNDYEVSRVESIIKTDLAISYKLIRMVNSSSFGLLQEISSIKQAIMLIGKEELAKWISVIAMSEMQSINDEEMTKNLIIRARFCELVANKIKYNKSEQCFLAGLFSTLDEYMRKNMEEIVEELPVESELKKALLGEENKINKILKLVKAYEIMDNFDIVKYTIDLGIDRSSLVDFYLEAINWQNKFEKNI